MASDLTRRLRQAAEVAGTDGAARLLTAAADEIDRLRALADRTPERCDEVLRLRAEVERLTALNTTYSDAFVRTRDERDKARAESVRWERIAKESRDDIDRLTAELAEERRPKSLWEQEDARRKREAAGQ